MAIVIFWFLVYGTISIWFNYYLHDFNKSTTEFFYQLSLRNVYGVVTTGMMREAVRIRDKSLLLKNPSIFINFLTVKSTKWREIYGRLFRRNDAS